MAHDDVARPRVLHFCEYLLGRSETFVQQRLRGDRFQPTIAGFERVVGGLDLPCPSVILPRRDWDLGRSLGARVVRRLGRPLNRARRALDLVALLARSAPAVVHAHFGPSGVAIAGACELLRIPLVTSFYGYDVGQIPRMPGGADLYGRLFSTAAALTAEGPALARALMRLGAPADAVKLLPLGVPGFLMGAPPPAKAKSASLSLLQVARFVEKKGVDVTLRALAAARHAGADARLVLVGDGPLRADIERLIADLALGNAVLLPGFVAHRELEAYFLSADAYVQPSRTAADGDTEGGHPTVLLEAQVRGLPVLATTHADIPLVVRDGATGLLCAENDHEALARHIVRFAKEPEPRTAMGVAARKMTLRRHDPKTLLSLQERLYREAIRRYRKTRPPLRIPRPPGNILPDPFEAPNP